MIYTLELIQKVQNTANTTSWRVAQNSRFGCECRTTKWNLCKCPCATVMRVSFKYQVPFTAIALTSADAASRSRKCRCVVVKTQGLNTQFSKGLSEAVHWTQGSAGQIVVTSLLESNPGIIVCGALRC